MERPDRFGMGPIFGSQQNFEKYRIVSLFEKRSELLRQHKRLILLGYAGFRDHHRLAHSLMNELGIRHEYRDGPERLHRWDSGWLLEAVELLAQATIGKQRPM